MAWSRHTAQLNRLDFADLSSWLGRIRRHTLILLSRHGTQAVVTCFRGAFLGLSGSGDMVDTMFSRSHYPLFLMRRFPVMTRIERGGGGSFAGVCALGMRWPLERKNVASHCEFADFNHFVKMPLTSDLEIARNKNVNSRKCSSGGRGKLYSTAAYEKRGDKPSPIRSILKSPEN